jgi:hypothetical protein
MLSSNLIISYRNVRHLKIYNNGPESLLIRPSSSSFVHTRLSGTRSRPTTSQKILYRRVSNPDLWIYCQELWLLDHRDGLLSFILNEFVVSDQAFLVVQLEYLELTVRRREVGQVLVVAGRAPAGWQVWRGMQDKEEFCYDWTWDVCSPWKETNG